MILPFIEEDCRAIFRIAGIDVLGLWEIPNRYTTLESSVLYYLESNPKYPDHALQTLRYLQKAKWFAVLTRAGMVIIGPRKRVLSIDWSHTHVRKEATEDDVTKGDDHVHAWTKQMAVMYLSVLAKALNQPNPVEDENGQEDKA